MQKESYKRKPPPQKVNRSDLKPDEVLCDYCTAKCCKYFALTIEEPESPADFDYMRWYLLHGRASVFVEEGVWFLLVHTECKHLMPDNRCGIYETRPQICRDYKTDDCEFDESYTYEKYFETAEQVAEYAEALFNQPDGESFRSPKPGLPVLNKA